MNRLIIVAGLAIIALAAEAFYEPFSVRHPRAEAEPTPPASFEEEIEHIEFDSDELYDDDEEVLVIHDDVIYGTRPKSECKDIS